MEEKQEKIDIVNVTTLTGEDFQFGNIASYQYDKDNELFVIEESSNGEITITEFPRENIVCVTTRKVTEDIDISDFVSGDAIVGIQFGRHPSC